MIVTLRQCDDWIAMYVDGVKVDEGHSIPLQRGLELANVSVEYVDLYDKIDYFTGLLEDGSEAFPEQL